MFTDNAEAVTPNNNEQDHLINMQSLTSSVAKTRVHRDLSLFVNHSCLKPSHARVSSCKPARISL